MGSRSTRSADPAGALPHSLRQRGPIGPIRAQVEASRAASLTAAARVPAGRRSASHRRRYVPLTQRLAAALREHRHLRGLRVLVTREGGSLTQKMVQDHVRRAARRASIEKSGVHMLRHTFCSHLAMRGVPARAIQELAGHQDLSTTQRYMHLSPAAIENAIRLLDGPVARFGDGVETGGR